MFWTKELQSFVYGCFRKCAHFLTFLQTVLYSSVTVICQEVWAPDFKMRSLHFPFDNKFTHNARPSFSRMQEGLEWDF